MATEVNVQTLNSLYADMYNQKHIGNTNTIAEIHNRIYECMKMRVTKNTKNELYGMLAAVLRQVEYK